MNIQIGDLVGVISKDKILDCETRARVPEHMFADFAVDEAFYMTVDGLITGGGEVIHENTNQDVVGVVFTPYDANGQRIGDEWWLVDVADVAEIVPAAQREAAFHSGSPDSGRVGI